MKKLILAVTPAILTTTLLYAQLTSPAVSTESVNAAAPEEKIDFTVVEQIKKEGFQNSNVMEIAFRLTDANGPRLTNSPGYVRAANYVKSCLKKWGLSNITFDSISGFGKGWELERFYIAMTVPYYKPVIAMPRAWTKGTSGAKTADVLLISAKEISSLNDYKGKLAGKILVLESHQPFQHNFKPGATRFTEDELQELESAKLTVKTSPLIKADSGFGSSPTTLRQQPMTVYSLLKQMGKEEGAVAFLDCNQHGRNGIIQVGARGGFRKSDPESMPDIVLAMEDYMTMVRLLKSNAPVKMEIDVSARFIESDSQAYNVIAEIPGNDRKLRDEVVMVGAHLDSWHGSTGATDNAAGVAVVMEAIRILKELKLKPRRTIRIALWGGEEQGLLGSMSYVKKTFVASNGKSFLPQHEKLSAYYNLDNGSGKIRGIYLEGNEAVRPIFKKWLEPFYEIGAKTLTHAKKAGGTDHLSFIRVGLPGFQFIQDPIDYHTTTHHTNMDSYDHLISEDLKTSAVIIASFLYHTAMRDERLPRVQMN
jgi:hypothetical protein